MSNGVFYQKGKDVNCRFLHSAEISANSAPAVAASVPSAPNDTKTWLRAKKTPSTPSAAVKSDVENIAKLNPELFIPSLPITLNEQKRIPTHLSSKKKKNHIKKTKSPTSVAPSPSTLQPSEETNHSPKKFNKNHIKKTKSPTSVAPSISTLQPSEETNHSPKNFNNIPLDSAVISQEKQAASTSPQVFAKREPFRRPEPKSLLSQTSDPQTIAQITRKIDIQAIQKRFPTSFNIIEQRTDSMITAHIVPSDPDFPFDLEYLEIKIRVPALYPTKHSSIDIMNDSIPILLRKRIQSAWEDRATRVKMTLLQMCNWLDRSLEELLVKQESKISFISNTTESTHTVPDVCNEMDSNTNFESETKSMASSSLEDQELEAKTTVLEQSPHRGIQIRFPNLKIETISLLVCTLLNISVRCSRCKETVDISIHATPNPQWLPCTRCCADIGIRFRQQHVHATHNAIGYLDIENATPFDLLPSTYIATCVCGKEQVPTLSAASHFKRLTRSFPVSMPCLTCHARMSLCVDQVKFVQLGPSILQKTASLVLKKAKVKKDVGVVAGEPLPNNGTCEHYRKSFRWFRFPCCGKLYPCDVCHEEKKGDGHDIQWATRMMCGFCAKEQNYSKDKNCSCGRELIKKGGSGFWEGGKGTRDRTKMSKNDDKKYKGLSKTVSNRARK